jgi:hypothetical protein
VSSLHRSWRVVNKRIFYNLCIIRTHLKAFYSFQDHKGMSWFSAITYSLNVPTYFDERYKILNYFKNILEVRAYLLNALPWIKGRGHYSK